ncbi:MAG: DUF4912 domain-containing protein [Nitrospinota bacterium]
MIKSELLNLTKTELVKFSKRRFGLSLKATLVKTRMVAEIVKAAKKATADATKKTGAMKKTPAKKSKKAATGKAVKAAKKTKNALRSHSAKKPVKTVEAETLPPPTAYDDNGRTAEEKAHEAKFFVAKSQEEAEFVPDNALRDRYQDNRIVLLVRDPFWIFAFWDLQDDAPSQTAQRHGIAKNSASLALRVYDVTEVDFDGTNAHKFFDIGISSAHGNWYINVPEDARTYCVEIGLKTADGGFHMIARSNAAYLPRAGVSSRVDEEWVVIDEDFWKMYALSGGFAAGQFASSQELQAAMQERFKQELASGAVGSFGGSEIALKKPKKGFWFKLDCELIVYGATEPDAKVMLGGKKVSLRPDGTFTARYALPDGIRSLPAVATSADMKFEKTITPTVSRNTAAFENVMEEETA